MSRMTQPRRAPKSIGFVHLVPFDRHAPLQGHLDGIELFRHAEALGLDSGWVRTRHLQHGLSSPAVFHAAVAQHTERIKLGTAVMPVGFENPFRLAEDLGTLDVISGGRLLPGLSVHPPRYEEGVNDLVYDTGWREEDYGYGRIERFRDMIDGLSVREVPEYQGYGGQFDSDRVEPQSEGLAQRLSYGGGSLKSARWAGAARMNWLVSNISTSENGITNFQEAQRAQIDAYREEFKAASESAGATHSAEADMGAAGAATQNGRVAVARVIVPLDGTTTEQEAKFRAYAQARNPRTEHVHPGNIIIARDMLGSVDEVVQTILDDPAYQDTDDYLFELPFEFELADWKLMLNLIATEIGPALGWKPAA